MDSASKDAHRRRPIMPGLLAGKVAVITGGATGIGLATAKTCVAEGAHVFIFGRRKAVLDAAVTAIGGDVTGAQGAAPQQSRPDRLYLTPKDQHGKPDIVFSKAAIARTSGP